MRGLLTVSRTLFAVQEVLLPFQHVTAAVQSGAIQVSRGQNRLESQHLVMWFIRRQAVLDNKGTHEIVSS